MKLLLTSAGISNQSIVNALFELVGKKPEDTSVVFIPTASNVEIGDKDWVIKDLVDLQRQHFRSIDIADISAVPESIWRQKFETADVLFFEGGSTFHLMEWIRKTGLDTLLPELLKSRVYVGVSAGSMVTNTNLLVSISQIVYEEDFDKTENVPGLGYVPFYLLPHLNSPYFPKLRKEHIEKAVAGMSQTVYALDDQSALKVVDGVVEVISEGEYLAFNQSAAQQ